MLYNAKKGRVVDNKSRENSSHFAALQRDLESREWGGCWCWGGLNAARPLVIGSPKSPSVESDRQISTTTHRAPWVLVTCFHVLCEADGVEAMAAVHSLHGLAQLIEYRRVG